VILQCLFGLLVTLAECEPANGPGSPVYRTAAAILVLSPDQADRGYPAEIRGVVTQSVESGLVIHDETAGIWIYTEGAESYAPGDELNVDGATSSGKFAPVIYARSIRVLGRAPLPPPIPATFEQLSTGNLDSQYVSVVGSVRSIGVRENVPRATSIFIKIETDGSFLTATLPATDVQPLNGLIDATVRVTGTVMCTKNDNRQIIAPTLAMSALSNMTVLKAAPTDPFTRPAVPISNLMRYRSGISYFDRLHVVGTVTYYRAGVDVVLEDRGAALEVRTTQKLDLAIGDRVEAVGFPAPQAGGPIVEDALLRRIAVGPPLPAQSVGLSDVCSGRLNYNLVSTEGRLLRRFREPSRETLLLQDKANVLVAELDSLGTADALSSIRDGSALRVTGITVLEIEGPWNYGANSPQAVRCRVLLRSPSDIQVSELPTWWTTQHASEIAIGLGVLALIFLILVFRSFVERSRLQAAFVERERLAQEIHDTLAQSFAGIGFQLQAIRRALPKELPHVEQQVDLARELVRHSHKEARRSIELLRSEPEAAGNLLAQLEQSAQRMVKGGAVEIAVSSEGAPRSLEPRLSNALLRIGQEAIANAVRHADPTRVQISLTYGGNWVMLSVRDDGVGFVKSGSLLGFGLRGMRKRAAAVGANLEIQSRPGEGTCIAVRADFSSPSIPATIFRSLWSSILEHRSHVPTE